MWGAGWVCCGPWGVCVWGEPRLCSAHELSRVYFRLCVHMLCMLCVCVGGAGGPPLFCCARVPCYIRTKFVCVSLCVVSMLK